MKEVIDMTTLTVAEFATRIDTDPRTARKFLRSITPKDAQPGKGSRWSIEAKQVRSLKSQFGKFIAAQDEARLAREMAKATPADAPQDAPEADDDEITEPTAEELAAIDAE